jgi:anti-sigma B factor antagonist
VKSSGDPDLAETDSFSVRVISTGERAARVLASGELDLATSTKLEGALNSALADADEVVLDLSNVTFIDSTGLSTILTGISTSQLRRRRLLISSRLGAQPRRLFELAGMDGSLPLVDE